MATLGLAAIQLAGKKQGNLELLESEVRSVARRFPWVDMVVCGELAVHGFEGDGAQDEKRQEGAENKKKKDPPRDLAG